MVVIASLALVVSLALATPAAATVVEPDGTTVPVDGGNGETQLSTFFAGADPSINAVSSAHSGPGLFYPAAGGTITFVMHQAAVSVALSWYNANGSPPTAQQFHTLFPLNSPLGASVNANAIRNDPAWQGGAIGLALVGGALNYSQPQYNPACGLCTPPNHWAMALEYPSGATPTNIYVAFEDSAPGPTGLTSEDFNDDVYLLQGMNPPQCLDTVDNDGDGAVDAADRGCWTGPGGTYDPTANDESADPPNAAVTFPSASMDLSLGDTITATVTQPGTGLKSCTLALDTSGDGSFTTPLTTTVAAGSPTTCSALVPSSVAAAHDFAVRATYTETFGTTTTATATIHVPGPPANTSKPAISGTPAVGQALTCSPGAWTENPSTFAYQWLRNGNPIAGQTGSSYTVAAGDEGANFTCTVTASNAEGHDQATSAGVLVPVTAPPGCPFSTGRLSGTTLGNVRLGMLRKQAKAAYGDSTDRGRLYEDFFCLTPDGVRVGYPSPALLKAFPKRVKKHWAGRAVWISSADPRYTIGKIHHGTILAAAQHLLRRSNLFVVGKNDWLLAPHGRVTVMLRIQRKKVVEIGIAAPTLTRTRAQQRAFVRSFY
jgi:hypothetical protein